MLTVELWLSFLYGCYNGAMVVYLTEIMPVAVRTVGFSLAYSLATAIFGGNTPAISQLLFHVTGNRAMAGLWLSSPPGAACWQPGSPGAAPPMWRRRSRSPGNVSQRGCCSHQAPSSEYATARRLGPMKRPRNPNERNPPNTPRITSAIGMTTPKLISHGRTKLSDATTSTVQPITNQPRKADPVWNSHHAAAAPMTLISGAPIWLSASIIVTKPSAAAPGMRAMPRPAPITTPWNAAVPTTP